MTVSAAYQQHHVERDPHSDPTSGEATEAMQDGGKSEGDRGEEPHVWRPPLDTYEKGSWVFGPNGKRPSSDPTKANAITDNRNRAAIISVRERPLTEAITGPQSRRAPNG